MTGLTTKVDLRKLMREVVETLAGHLFAAGLQSSGNRRDSQTVLPYRPICSLRSAPKPVLNALI